jgi:hypothetical protein
MQTSFHILELYADNISDTAVTSPGIYAGESMRAHRALAQIFCQIDREINHTRNQ